jgi:hypothetical protein
VLIIIHSLGHSSPATGPWPHSRHVLTELERDRETKHTVLGLSLYICFVAHCRQLLCKITDFLLMSLPLFPFFSFLERKFADRDLTGSSPPPAPSV